MRRALLYLHFGDVADEVRFIFLTPSGIASRCSDPEAAQTWVNVSYQVVADALRAALEATSTASLHPAGRVVAATYLETVERELL